MFNWIMVDAAADSGLIIRPYLFFASFLLITYSTSGTLYLGIKLSKDILHKVIDG